MGGWMDDLRSAMRSLRRSPGFAAFAVGTLALGIGATITFASFLDRIVLRPIDFPHGDRLVMAMRSREAMQLRISPDLETRNRVRSADVFDGVAAVGFADVAWSTDEGPRILSSVKMDQELPRLAGLPPVLGRYFTDDEFAGDGAPVVILSEGLWKSAFGSDPDILGKSIRIEGTPRTIVGVAPDAVRPPRPARGESDILVPLGESGETAGLDVYARLKDGVTLDQALERVKALDLVAAETEKSTWTTTLVPVSQMATARLRSPLKVAGVAVAMLLLIACLNVANLLLARGDTRVRDTAVRAAVGAGRTRLARETFMESSLIALAAAALGLGMAASLVSSVRRLAPADLPLLTRLSLDPGVTALAVTLGVVTVLLFGMLPLAHRVRTRPGAVLTERSGTGDKGTVSLRRFLLVGEVALSFALLAGGVQVVTTLSEVRSRNPGLAVNELLSVRLRLPDWRFADDASREAVIQEFKERLATVPGVRAVSPAVGIPPHTGIYVGQGPQAEGQPPIVADVTTSLFFGNSVEPGYFATVGQEIVRGRDFTPEDRKAEVVPFILGETAAAKYFPDGGAVGGRFRLGPDGPWHQVIGVARDIWVTGGANDPMYPQLYLPRSEGDGSDFAIRADDPAAVAPAVREVIHAVDPEVPITEMGTVVSSYRAALARESLVAMLLAAFAATAALLAAVGLYGVVSQIAVRRTREFGIRLSLGAEPISIFRLALRGGVFAVGGGLTAGAGLAWAGLRLMKMGVAGLDQPDPWSFSAAALLLALATLAAMCLPAARASRIDPTEALRAE